ncbi:hypothetical protein Cni_G13892 [Canna indica]|uniref:Uncharacterized protein n=1 Tax=Canna indica TaxID=4628 RepID=A0AAQ3QA71_9LILI|nr:hypothetical protein Cni_G13892 [Canna indica]
MQMPFLLGFREEHLGKQPFAPREMTQPPFFLASEKSIAGSPLYSPALLGTVLYTVHTRHPLWLYLLRLDTQRGLLVLELELSLTDSYVSLQGALPVVPLLCDSTSEHVRR